MKVKYRKFEDRLAEPCECCGAPPDEGCRCVITGIGCDYHDGDDSLWDPHEIRRLVSTDGRVS